MKKLKPVRMQRDAAPASLLKLVKCNCHGVVLYWLAWSTTYSKVECTQVGSGGVRSNMGKNMSELFSRMWDVAMQYLHVL